MATHDNMEALMSEPNFPSHEGEIRKAYGLNGIIEVDRLMDMRNEDEQELALFDFLSGEQ